TNPFEATQNLYPGHPRPMKNGDAIDPFVLTSSMKNNIQTDPLVLRMNKEGPRSIFSNPGEYTLVVAEYTGRTDIAVPIAKGFEESLPDERERLKQSPLARAADEAESLADVLAKSQVLRTAGIKPYVYHTQFASMVTLGSFTAETDPRAKMLRDDV